MQYRLLFVALAAAITLVLAQQAPDCNAFEKTCPATNTKGHINYDLTQTSALNEWTTLGGAVVTGTDGAEFTIHKQGDSPTIVTGYYYIFYGEVSVEMKASPSTGIVSAVYMLSDANDEIDWEALGGSTDKLQTNYYGKGDNSEDYDRWTWQPVTSPQEVFHKYTWIWSKEKLSWAIDGTVLRTVDHTDAKGGTRFPQTPMRVRIGIWAEVIRAESRARSTGLAVRLSTPRHPSIRLRLSTTLQRRAMSIPINLVLRSIRVSPRARVRYYTASLTSSTSSSTVLSTTTSFVTSSSAESETSTTIEIAISTSSAKDFSSSSSPSGLSSTTPSCSNPASTPPTISSAEPQSTTLRSNSTSAASSTTTASSISNSGTGAVASATSSFNSACTLGSGYLSLLTLIVGFVQMWTWVLCLCT
ncbi:hypothetical protein N7449_009638 [Penicillium cf. viridicatum]|uniref:chitinase n=1 Tax=Penicillium cf. viridicatum TaxID=2972119 RepID=A0A9W9M884_9EURO|nr:hypothetical protein N7449_009638 [Penicillium cf. viridicatum]